MGTIESIKTTTLEGILNGVKIITDPLGFLVVSRLTSIDTIGERGLTGLNKNGERNPEVNYDSIYYIIGKVSGEVLGIYVQFQTIGIINGITTAINIYNHRNQKEDNCEKSEEPYDSDEEH